MEKKIHEKKKLSIIIIHDYIIFNAFHSSHSKIGKIIQTLVIVLFLWAFEYSILIRFIPNCFIYFHNITHETSSRQLKHNILSLYANGVFKLNPRLLSNAMSLPNFLSPWTHSYLVHVFINFNFKCFKC